MDRSVACEVHSTFKHLIAQSAQDRAARESESLTVGAARARSGTAVHFRFRCKTVTRVSTVFVRIRGATSIFE